MMTLSCLTSYCLDSFGCKEMMQLSWGPTMYHQIDKSTFGPCKEDVVWVNRGTPVKTAIKKNQIIMGTPKMVPLILENPISLNPKH